MFEIRRIDSGTAFPMLYTQEIMSDDPLTSRRQPQQNSRKRRRPPAPPPKESRLIGYIVLSVGAIALISMLVIAFIGRTPRPPANAVPAKTLVPELMDLSEGPPPPPPQTDDQLKIDRQPDINLKEMEGAWQAMVGDYTGVLQLQKGSYQIILAQSDPRMARLFSSGTYKTMEDIIVLTPRLDWQTPTSAQGNAVNYQILTRGMFPVLVSMRGGKMTWQNPPQNEKRVVVPFRSPVLAAGNVDFITWQRLE